MPAGPLKLYWNKQLAGIISEAGWADFPWLAGKFEARRMSKPLRAVLEWFATQADADRLEEPPFAAELLEGWAVVKPDRNRVELPCPPIVRFTTGSVEWRE
jgi:hypothetical protein